MPKQLSPWQPWAQPGTDKADYPHEGYKPGYMDHLIDQKKKLEAEKEELVRKLRAERNMAAQEAAIDSNILHAQRLERALHQAKQRQLEKVKAAVNRAAAEMHRATVAKQYSVHAKAVAMARIRQLKRMIRDAKNQPELISTHGVRGRNARDTPVVAVGTAKPVAAVVKLRSVHHKRPVSGSTSVPVTAQKGATKATLATDGGLNESGDSSAAKLTALDAQEAQLQAKIAQVKRAAARARAKAGGKHESPLASAEQKLISSMAKTLVNNERQLRADRESQAQLSSQEVKLSASMQALVHRNAGLSKALHH